MCNEVCIVVTVVSIWGDDKMISPTQASSLRWKQWRVISRFLSCTITLKLCWKRKYVVPCFYFDLDEIIFRSFVLWKKEENRSLRKYYCRIKTLLWWRQKLLPICPAKRKGLSYLCRVTNVKHLLGTQTKSRDRWASIVASYLGIVSFDEHENSLKWLLILEKPCIIRTHTSMLQR